MNSCSRGNQRNGCFFLFPSEHGNGQFGDSGESGGVGVGGTSDEDRVNRGISTMGKDVDFYIQLTSESIAISDYHQWNTVQPTLQCVSVGIAIRSLSGIALSSCNTHTHSCSRVLGLCD